MRTWNGSTPLADMRKFLRLWLPVLLWMGVIFIGSSIGSFPEVGGRTADAIVHRTAHLIEFTILGWLVLRANGDGWPLTRRAFITTLIIVTLYGASDEFHQRFTPGRSSELSAVVFDAAGGLIGAGIYRVWRQRTGRKATQSSSNELRDEAIPLTHPQSDQT
ncbi:MAG TPA: VanZ family protein [Anaerolineae bacterium]|nr:VanZ family protein [Anaerolineae bacterium]